MTYTTSSASNPTDELAKEFEQLDVDQQLALFYFIYKEMGSAVTPAAPAASTVSPEVAEGLFAQVKEMSQEEQLQVQRDLISRQNTYITRAYGALSDTTKLLFWYLLAQGMDGGTIVPMPPDYQLPGACEHLLTEIKALEFNQQITLFRNIVSPMGVDPTVVPQDPATGL